MTTAGAWRFDAGSGVEGTLAELAQGLRRGRISPRDLDLLALVRAVLTRFHREAARDVELASEALPQAAAVIELKVRLLLPAPPREGPDEAAIDRERELALAAIAELAALEGVIAELRERRERRRSILPARAAPPDYPRVQRPLRRSAAHLADLAGKFVARGYFEVAREGPTLREAIARLLARLLPGRRVPFLEVVGDGSWSARSLHLLAALELVREGRCALHQEAAFGPLEIEGIERRP